eukprot:2045087-Pleurochrysis_carterae.AAC.3
MRLEREVVHKYQSTRRRDVCGAKSRNRKGRQRGKEGPVRQDGSVDSAGTRSACLQTFLD